MAIGVKHDPICPRCGYDLRGTAATWADGGSCPLDGVCTECGLTFRWVDVFDPTREEPKWCVEYATRRPLRFGRAVIGTLLRSWLPWVFWKRLRLHHEVRLRRIAVYVMVLLIVPTVFIYVVAQSTTASYARAQIAEALGTMNQVMAQLLPANQSQFEQRHEYRQLNNVPAGVQYDVVNFVLRNHRELVDSDWAPEVVEELDQEKWEAMWVEYERFLEEWIEHATEAVRNPPRIQISYLGAVTEAVFRPWSNTSRGVIESSGEIEPYLSPREIYFVVPGASMYYDDAAEVLDEVVERSTPLLAWLILLIAYPLTFALLPITRRRARVRWRHFARIGLYSIAIPIVLLHLCVLSLAASLWHERTFTIWDDSIDLFATFGPVPLALAWWYFAIRNHLRLPHPLLVTIVLAVLTPLAVGATVQVSVWLVQLFAG